MLWSAAKAAERRSNYSCSKCASLPLVQWPRSHEIKYVLSLLCSLCLPALRQPRLEPLRHSASQNMCPGGTIHSGARSILRRPFHSAARVCTDSIPRLRIGDVWAGHVGQRFSHGPRLLAAGRVHLAADRARVRYVRVRHQTDRCSWSSSVTHQNVRSSSCAPPACKNRLNPSGGHGCREDVGCRRKTSCLKPAV